MNRQWGQLLNVCRLLLTTLWWGTGAIAGDGVQLQEYPSVVNRAFDVGEHLTYSVDFGPIHAGTASLSVTSGDTLYNRPTWRIVSTARSSEQFSYLYEVNDRTESLMDRDGLFSWGISKSIHEGKFHKDSAWRIDYEAGRIIGKKDTLAVTAITHDMLTALYYLRTQRLRVGETLTMPVFDNKKQYTMEVAVLKRESIKIKSGIYDTLVLEPRLQTAGIFYSKGKIRAWLTTDRRRIPVKMSTRFFFGSIDVTLTDDGSQAGPAKQ
jgi:hypothetical protein